MSTASILGSALPPPVAFPLQLAIVEDDLPTRTLLHDYLCRGSEFTCFCLAGSIEALWQELDLALPPQLLLLDLNLPGESGLQALPRLVQRFPKLRVLVQTMHDDADTIYQALRAGASGYVIKSATSLKAYRQALLDVAQGGGAMSPAVASKVMAYFTPLPSQQPTLLSERERQVLEALVDGLSQKQAAARLELTHATVHTYVRRLYEKLQVNSRAELLGRFARGDL